MTETIDFEQVGLLLGLAAARDQRTVGEADTLAWHQDLNAAGITYADAEAAITHFYAVVMAGTQPQDRRRITTPDIISIAKRLRRERLENFRYEPADADESPREFLARLRRQIAVTAAGQAPIPPSAVRQLEGGPHPAVARALAGVGREVPGEDTEPGQQRRPARLGPMSVRCPECGAPIGRKCRAGASQFARRPHRARRDAARVAAGCEPEPREDSAVIELRRAASARFLADQGGAS